MKTSQIPMGVIDDVNKLNMNFLWFEDREKEGMSLVAWEKVRTPKSIEGLGQLNLWLRNDASLGKLSWRLLKEPQALWSPMLIAKYGRPSVAIDKEKMYFSHLERAIAWV